MKRLMRSAAAIICAALFFWGAGCTAQPVNPKPQHTHTYSSDWSRDAYYHWHASTCGHAEEVGEMGLHTIEDGVYSGFDGLSLVYRWQENLQAIGAGKSGTQESVPPVLPARQKTVEEALRGCSRWKRALYYWLFDRKTFHEKMKKRRAEKRSRT